MENKRPLVDFTKLKRRRFNQQQNTSSLNTNQTSMPSNQQNQTSSSTTNTINNAVYNENLNTQINQEYDTYLDRILQIITECNPEMLNKEKTLLINAPQVAKVGTRTVWSNFNSICKSLNRPVDHVYAFFVKELGTETSLGQENQFFMKGRYISSKLESLILKYSKEFVRCPNCKSTNTVLNKINKIRMLECNNCKNTKTVAKIN